MLRIATTLLLGAAAIGGAVMALGKTQQFKSKKSESKLLDEALDETFPASDPISPSAGTLSYTERKMHEKAKNAA
jgi:hypothetical protein